MSDVAAPESVSADPTSNAHAFSVSELAFALKRTIEDQFGFVRLRGELSKVTFHSNGHVYLDIKDERASISGVIWKTQVRTLGVRPQTGLEVIVTGKITTYPGRSQYQIIIETMAPAGVGALLAQLERLKAKLAAEGLFEAARKRRLPSMPAVVGVITSPTGAVIRDILHRIRERWPCRVIVWPSVMQGDGAAAQVAAAIAGFNALQPGGPIPRPDVLIVARGGGSVEDLWPFNDEALARAAAASAIPLISAVGHETDTTLIDFVSDRRAPTPTAAAEIATPVFAELAASLADHERRLIAYGARAIEQRRTRLSAAARGLPRPQDLLGLATQRLDIAAGRLAAGLQRNVSVHAQALAGPAAAMKPGLLQRPIALKRQRLAELSARLAPIVTRRLQREGERLASLERQRVSLNPEGPLERGYTLIRRANGRLATSARELAPAEAVRLRFKDGERNAIIDGAPGRKLSRTAGNSDQGDLF
ncbi:MAG TPA: exodeoxyribonuclease VII large subunit [Caulobacteraceae bacterium]|nr:exodeoxyribonuclease VII large subunit [Caulobacteraceae bacterium]